MRETARSLSLLKSFKNLSSRRYLHTSLTYKGFIIAGKTASREITENETFHREIANEIEDVYVERRRA